MPYINCDMGESFGLYKLGDDESIMPYITHANVACGMHASDPNHMEKTVILAKKHGVHVGAHFSLPDLQGFGRREMVISREELTNFILYQVGALSAFVKKHGMQLSHLKPHGALYGMAARQPDAAMAVIDVAQLYQLPVYGMRGSVQDTLAKQHDVPFVAEFFADLDYDANAGLIISKQHLPADLGEISAKVKQAVVNGRVKTVQGSFIKVQADTICVHSDTPNAAQLVKQVAQELLQLKISRVAGEA